MVAAIAAGIGNNSAHMACLPYDIISRKAVQDTRRSYPNRRAAQSPSAQLAERANCASHREGAGQQDAQLTARFAVDCQQTFANHHLLHAATEALKQRLFLLQLCPQDGAPEPQACVTLSSICNTRVSFHDSF